MKRTNCVPNSIHFTDDSFLLGVMGINVFAKPYEVVEISSISEHDVFFGIDDDGDLVRTEVG